MSVETSEAEMAAVPAGKRTLPRAQLLDTAEQLFAQKGIEGVSLREIAVAAGQKNNSAVHYYFKNKTGLVEALLADRMNKVEHLRQDALSVARPLSECSLEDLFTMMWQPMIELCRRQGGNWIVQFHLACNIGGWESIANSRHPLSADPIQHPASSALLAAISLRCTHIDADSLRYRLGLIFMMFWVAVARDEGPGKPATAFSLANVVRMAVAVLQVPA